MNADTVPIAVPVPSAPPSATAPPAMPASSAFPSFSRISELNYDQIKQLKSQGYTQGLIDIIAQMTEYFPHRVWVVDNSGSMNKDDGNRLINTKNSSQVRLVQCTRWDEIRETVNYHAQLSALIQAPTTFRLLNNPGMHVGSQEFSIADKGYDKQIIDKDVETAKRIMNNASPSGVTPLARHVREIRDSILPMADDLHNQGKKVTIILATDGLPTNERGVGGYDERNDFTEALRSMEGLPVWIVIRLCTDEDDVVEYYNSIDDQLELSIEVLDDFFGEANEVHEHNSWLTYTLPLHRMREMGIPHRLFDLLDERPFTRSELRDFCFLLFGQGAFDGVPEPEEDFAGFIKALDGILKREKEQWDPVKKKMRPLLHLKEMNRIYGMSSSCTIM